MTTAPIAVTCGDPAGIGPELAFKAWSELGHQVPMVWFGDPDLIPDHIVWHNFDDTGLLGPGDSLPVYPIHFPNTVQPGRPDNANAQAVIDCIQTAVSHTQSGKCSAVVTAPISKSVLIEGAGFAFPGHTEFLAHLDGANTSIMLLASDALNVVPLTIHVPIRDVPTLVTQDLITTITQMLADDLSEKFGITNPHIAIAGLNPHASENGKIGTEDLDITAPAIKDLQDKGVNVTGPWPADTLFHAAARAKYDVALCMYHDQALIPVKTLAFDDAVNATLGLSFLRTSPDHGTAFDIAGQGIANPGSFIAACKMAHSHRLPGQDAN